MENQPVPAGQTVSPENLTEQVLLAKTDRHALNTLLHEYMPFIKKCVSRVFFKYQSKEDNLTDAMFAFANSVQTYNPEHGAFIAYAATVIRNRLIDSARKELSVQKKILPLSSQINVNDDSWEADVSLQAYDRAEEERNLSIEIEAVNNEFSKWGFSWATLLKKCPKQERSRRIALRAANAVLGSAGLLGDTLKNHQLPITRLAETFPRKVLEKYRQYIAAIIILSQGDYPYVYSFIPQTFTGEDAV